MSSELHRLAYTIVGAGAIGGTLAWHLARAGHQVALVDTDADHRAAIIAGGIVLERAGAREAQAVKDVFAPHDCPPNQQRVLLAVKANATESATAWLAGHLAADGFVVSMQNGLNESVLGAVLGPERVVGAFVNLFADVVGPGVIRDGGMGALAIGEVGGPISERVRGIVTDLQAWGPAIATDNLLGYLWSKLGFGAMLAGTALADDTIANLLDRHRDSAHALAREVFSIASARGIIVEPFDAFDAYAYAPPVTSKVMNAATDRLVRWLSTQSKDRTGIWRDIVVRHRPTEIPVHYAPVLEAADATDIPVPVLRALLAELAAVEEAPASMSEDRLDRLDAIARMKAV